MLRIATRRCRHPANGACSARRTHLLRSHASACKHAVAGRGTTCTHNHAHEGGKGSIGKSAGTTAKNNRKPGMAHEHLQPQAQGAGQHTQGRPTRGISLHDSENMPHSHGRRRTPAPR
jgi:hypothetical protein